jgi:hypothetical protein
MCLVCILSTAATIIIVRCNQSQATANANSEDPRMAGFKGKIIGDQFLINRRV